MTPQKRSSERKVNISFHLYWWLSIIASAARGEALEPVCASTPVADATSGPESRDSMHEYMRDRLDGGQLVVAPGRGSPKPATPLRYARLRR